MEYKIRVKKMKFKLQ